MPVSDVKLVQDWQKAHPNEGSWDIFLWTDLADQTDYAFEIEDEFEKWLEAGAPKPVPEIVDLVEAVAIYGYLRLRLNDWKLPIDLPESEYDKWRKGGYYVTLDDWYAPVSWVAGGFLKPAGQHMDLTVQILKEQLEQRFKELEEMLARPLETYNLKRTDEAIRKFLKDYHGMQDGPELEDALEEEKLEESHIHEAGYLDKPFALRTLLQSFAWGLEKFRILCRIEHAPDVGLPNPALHAKLMEIDLNAIYARLYATDEGLKRILRHLAKQGCLCLNAGHEPEAFWWRHWKQKTSKPPHPHQGAISVGFRTE